MNKLKSLLLAVVGLLFSMRMSAYDFKVNGLYFNIMSSVEKTVSVTLNYGGGSYSGVVVIPETVIYNNINYNVKGIDDFAFSECSGLSSVEIPNSVTNIGEEAFSFCSGLTSVTIGDGVVNIGDRAFSECSGLSSVEIPNSVTNIGEEAFSLCSGLTSVTIGDGVVNIGDDAFICCSGLSSVDIPNSVTNIGHGAFVECVNLTSLEIGDSVVNIGDDAFLGCSGLSSVEIPNGVTNIGHGAFAYCIGLTFVEIGNSVTNIGDRAFIDCENLKLVINHSELDIHRGTSDYGCVAYYADRVLFGELIDGYYFDEIKLDDYSEYVLTGYLGDEVNLVLPDNYKGQEYRIGNDAFYNCDNLTSVVIPNKLWDIGDNAFYGCVNLKTVVNNSFYIDITKGNDYYGYVAYYASRVISGELNGNWIFDGIDGAYVLTGFLVDESDMILPDNYKGQGYSIGKDAFFGCSGLISVTIGDNVTSIGNSAFSGCSGLISVVIPNSVTSIGEDAFSGCSGLTSVTIGDNVTSIGNSAFSGCSGLTSVVIPNSVTSIGENAFFGCSGLTSVEIGNSVTNIGTSTFYNCKNIRTVVNHSDLKITKGSTDFGDVALYAVRLLSGKPIDGFYFDETDGKYVLTGYWGNETNLFLPNDYNGDEYSIGEYAFWDCSGLTSVIIGNRVNSIGKYAFWNCSSLTSMVIPNNVTNISERAFENCSGLKSLTIGSGCLAIGSYQSTPTKTIWLTNTPPNGWFNLKGLINYVANTQYGISSNIRVYPYLSSIFETDGVKYVPVSPSERTCDAIDCCYEDSLEEIKIGETVSYKGVVMSVKNVLPYTMYGYKTIREVSLSNNGNVEEKAFFGCTSIANAVISNEGNIGMSAFEATMVSEKAELKVMNKGNIGDKAFYRCSAITDATISNEGDIGGAAFGRCTSLSTLTLGNNIESIGESAFSECYNLTEVKIPNQVTELGPYCFAGIPALMYIELGDRLQTIGNYCFSGCGLESVSIPASVTNIKDYAFNECTKLSDVVIEDRTAELSLGSNESSPLFADCSLDSVYIGGDITYNTSRGSGYSPFYRNATLRTVVITDKEDEIYDNMFYGCLGLKNVTIGDGVKKIGNWAFSGCSNLDYFAFGKNVESIGEEAFSDCVNVTQIISSAAIPPICGTQALDDINKWNCTLKVPMESLADYQQAEQWKDFFFIEGTETGIGNISSNRPSDGKCDVYGADGRLIRRNANVRSLKKGLYIINGKKVLVK